VIKTVDLKLVSAQKFRMAISELSNAPSDAATREPVETNQSGTATDAGYSSTVDSPLVGAAQGPEECIAICIDRSGSMGTPFAEVTLNVVKGATKSSVAERTRMEAVKAMFYAFRDRVESMGKGKYQLGLLQFDYAVEEMLDVTSQLDRFESIVDDLEKRGATAIYSSIVEAARMLKRHHSCDTSTDLRILVLTDGQNNKGCPPEDALSVVNEIGAVVDAIVVGDNPDANLRKIVSATDGECYQVSSLGEGFELLESESVVSLRARRGGAAKPAFTKREAVDFDSLKERAITSGSSVKRAPILSANLASKSVVSVRSIDKHVPAAARTGSVAKRLLAELEKVANGVESVWMHSGEGVHLFPAADDLQFWRALIEGPEDSPFRGGVFALNVIVPDRYPFEAPRISFETPIYHCNVNDSGKICLDILYEKWSPALSIPKCVEAIRIMMANPDTNNALRQWIADLTLTYQKYLGTETPDMRYIDEAKEQTQKHAFVSVDEWKQRWGC